MIKNLLLLILILFLFQSAKAQKQDSILVYMKNSGQILETKDSADYSMLIMTPPDNSTGTKINRVKQFYNNGNAKLLGTAIIHLHGKMMNMQFVGPYINFYPNGERKHIATYQGGKAIGIIRDYYPNGKLYTIAQFDKYKKLIECRDSTGKILAENGNGNWIIFDDDYKHKTDEGPITDSAKNGEWHEFVNDTAKYVTVYKMGSVVSTNDSLGQVFSAVEDEPTFNGGMYAFYKFLQMNIHYPDSAKKNNIQGRVIVEFVIEKDGSITNVKAIKGPDESLEDEAIRVIMLSSPWIPGTQNNKPVRVQFTVPISFALGNG
jgi:TonB family protein